MMRVERVATFEDLNRLAADWARLDASIALRTPFTSFEWNRLWWLNFRRRTLPSRDDFFVHTVRDEADKLVAVAPMMISAHPGRGPALLRMLRFFGADQTLTEVRGLICRREDEPAALAALLEHFNRIADRWDIVEWNGVWSHEALQTLKSAAPLLNQVDNSIYYLRLNGTWEELRAGLASKTKKHFRQNNDRLEQAGKTFALRVAGEDAVDLEPALERLMHLHSLRASAEDMFKHPDKFRLKKNRILVEGFVKSMREKGQARIFELLVDGQVAASRLGFCLGETLYVYYTGYDPVWKQYRVGSILMVEVIKWAISNRFQTFNRSTGTDRSKLQWCPDEDIFVGGVQIARTARARIAAALYYRALQLNRRIAEMRKR